MAGKLFAHLRGQWMGALALFLVLTGGVAYAADTIFSTDIVDDQVFSVDVRNDTLPGGGLTAADLRAGSVRGPEALDNSLTGADILESSLGEVPSARTGGVGRDTGRGGVCDPESAEFITCQQTGTITLAGRTRVLIIGHIRATSDGAGQSALGQCRVGTNAGFLPESTVPTFVNLGQPESLNMSGVTGVIGPGPIAFGLDCNEGSGGIQYELGHLSFVQLSPG